MNLKKKNEAAILVSNEALTALNWFRIQAGSGEEPGIGYNDVVRWLYDALYKKNVECDFVWPESENLSKYKAIFVPALHAVPDETLKRLNRYAEEGGTLLVTFKSGFANEYVKVHSDVQPHILREALGVRYDQFTFPKHVGLKGTFGGGQARIFMELVQTEGAEVLAAYDHPAWGGYAAITRNSFGKGTAYYVGCMTDEKTLDRLLEEVLKTAEIMECSDAYPVIVRKGKNDYGKTIRYFLNFSGEEQNVACQMGEAKELLSGEKIREGSQMILPAWGVKIIEE